jgi:hypothetical protein
MTKHVRTQRTLARARDSDTAGRRARERFGAGPLALLRVSDRKALLLRRLKKDAELPGRREFPSATALQAGTNHLPIPTISMARRPDRCAKAADTA